MTEETAGQTTEPEKQTETKKGQKKAAKSQTTQKWSIVTEIETKSLAAKAAKKANKKLFEWIDHAIRETATSELKAKPQPPAKPEDLVTDIVAKVAQQMQKGQEEATKAQTDLIEQQSARIDQLTQVIQNQPRNLKEWIFGKPDSKAD